MFNMCQCLFIMSFMFGSTELYVETVERILEKSLFKITDLKMKLFKFI